MNRIKGSKLFLFFVILLLFNFRMTATTPSVVSGQHVKDNFGASATTRTTPDLPSSVTSGNYLVFVASWCAEITCTTDGGTDLSSANVVSVLGNSFTNCGETPATAVLHATTWIAKITNTGTDHATITWHASASIYYPFVGLSEVNGIAAASACESASASAGISGTPTVTLSGSTTECNEYIDANFMSVATSVSSNSPYTSINNDTNRLEESKAAVSPATETATATASSSAAYVGILVGLRSDAGSCPASIFQRRTTSCSRLGSRCAQ